MNRRDFTKNLCKAVAVASIVPVAYNHHWRSKLVDEGDAARAKIKRIKESIK